MRYITLFLILFIFGCKQQIKKETITVVETSRVDYLPYYNEESFTPNWLTPGSKEERAFHKISDFKLTNQLGEMVTQKTFDHKIYIADFFFTTCPGICPKMTGNMFKVQEVFRNDPEIVLVSHSVMPGPNGSAAITGINITGIVQPL